MNAARLTPWLIGGVMLVLVAGVSGWAFGAGAANGKSDAETAREEGYKEGFDLVFTESSRITAKRGFRAGAKRGSRSGALTGTREGTGIGAGNVEIEKAVDAEKGAEAAASAAASEIAARQPNCGVVPAAPSWCPTSEELSGYRAAVKAAKEAAEKAREEKEKQREEARNDRP